MEKLLKQIENHLNVELTSEHYGKVDGTIQAGKMIGIHWVDRINPDFGYLFRLPIQDDEDEMYDLCVHITNVDNSDGIGKGHEEWVHLTELLSIDRVVKISVY